MPDLDGAASRPAGPYLGRSRWQERSVGFYGGIPVSKVMIIDVSTGPLPSMNYGCLFAVVLIDGDQVADDCVFFGGLNDLPGVNKLGLRVRAGKLVFTCASTTSNMLAIDTGLTMPFGKWVAVCAQKNSGVSTVRGAVKVLETPGVWQFSDSIATSPDAGSAATFLDIGSRAGGLTSDKGTSFYGSIAAVGLFKDRVLSDATIQTLHTKAGLINSAPDAYWLLNNIAENAKSHVEGVGTGASVVLADGTGIGAPVPGSWLA